MGWRLIVSLERQVCVMINSKFDMIKSAKDERSFYDKKTDEKVVFGADLDDFVIFDFWMSLTFTPRCFLDERVIGS